MKGTIYTLGYTLFSAADGVDTAKLFRSLQEYGVNYLIDVRSIPFSRQYPQCNADHLKKIGHRLGIPYVHMPELGARAEASQDVFSPAGHIFLEEVFPIAKSNRPEKTALVRDDLIVDFKKFRAVPRFRRGLQRLERAYRQGFTLALMCSEKDPISCHRYFLISRAIEQNLSALMEIKHLTADENGGMALTTQQELNARLTREVAAVRKIKPLHILEINQPEQADLLAFAGSMEHPVLQKYAGRNDQERQADFCDRYWNVLHGWKRSADGTEGEHDHD